jgi:hypothetical protein
VRVGGLGLRAVPRAWPRTLRRGLLVLSFGTLVAVGMLGENAAKPGLGPRGWAPGDLPWHPSATVVTVLLVAAYGLGTVAVATGLLNPSAAPPWSWRPVLALAGLALLTAPFGSADHTNYAAYGRIAAQGGDPYLVAPEDWAGGRDPVTSAVQPPWTKTVSVYGPLATLLHALSSLVGGDNVRQTVWVWQLVTVVAWLAVRALVLHLAADDGTSRARMDLLWTANPLVFGVGVLGAHLDLVATALAVLALACLGRSPLLSGAFVGLAVSTKVTYALVGVAVLAAWALSHRQGLLTRVAAFGAGAAATAVPLHVWAGPYVFDQIARSRRSVSLATPWRPLLEWLAASPLPATQARAAVSVLAAVVFVLFAAALWRLTAGRAPQGAVGQAVRCTFVLTTAYALAAPYSLPWYDQLSWAVLPLLAAGPVEAIVLARLAVMALAYVPGRVVALTPEVEEVTLGFRTQVAPYAVLLVWSAVALAARHVSPSRRRPRPQEPGRSRR